MSKQDELLEREIGDLGSEQKESLGKLNHIPGQKAALNESEQESLEQFKRAVNTIRIADRGDISDGWIPINRADMGFRSQFYPTDWEFRIRPATVEAIKNWSSIDENSLPVVNKVMNEIIRSCVSIQSARGRLSWDKINSWDRFWFILKVREYTFSKGEQALEFDEECDNCGENIHYTLQAENLYYEFPDNDVVERHWSQDQMTWNIDPEEYGLPGRAHIKLYVPTIQKDNAILDWLYSQSEAGKQLDEVFIKFLPYMLENAPKDPSLLDKKIKECQYIFKHWDVDMFMFMDDIRRNIAIIPSEKLIQKCPSCGEEVKSTVRFPNGIKYLFAIQSKYKKFGSK